MLSTDIGCGWPVALHCLDGRCLIGVRALQCHLKVMIDGKCRPEYRHHKEMLDVSRGTSHNIVFQNFWLMVRGGQIIMLSFENCSFWYAAHTELILKIAFEVRGNSHTNISKYQARSESVT